MKTYRVLFTAEAERDLEDIFDHVATSSGEDRARAVVSSLVGRCLALDLLPHRGRPRDELFPGLRVIPHRDSASIAFTTDDASVRIEAVLWRGRDVGIIARRRR